MYSINISGHNHNAGLSGIVPSSSETSTVHITSQTGVHTEHPRLLVGNILDATSVVTISPQIHHLQQPIHHHVIQQHPVDHSHHMQHQFHQQTLHAHETAHHPVQNERVELEPVTNGIPDHMENRVVIDSNNMIVSVVGEVVRANVEEGPSQPNEHRRCFVCNNVLDFHEPEKTIRADATILGGTKRKLSDIMGKIVGASLCTLLGNEMCNQCFCLIEKIDALELELSKIKIEVIKKCESTLKTRHPGNKLSLDIQKKQMALGEDDAEEGDVYESPAEGNLDDPSDPDVTLATLRQGRKKKFKKKLPLKKKMTTLTAAFFKNYAKKNFTSGKVKRGRGRPPKKDKIEVPHNVDTVTQVCPCCQKNIEVEKYLLHLGSHKVFPCPFCSSVYKRKDIKNHIAELHQDEPNYPCVGCDLTFDAFTKLRRHCNIIHMGIETDSAKCPLCDKIFSSANGLKVHIETIHENSQMFECSVCKESFNQRGNMKNHFRRVHEGEQAKKLQCDTCNKCFICPSDLRKHVERVHLKIKKDEVLCMVCSKPFSDQRALKVHVNAVHTKAIKFPCSDCKMVFHSLTNMVTHRRRMHGGNGGRKHVCEICSKAFCSPSDLRTHVKVVHENVRKYVCDICGQGFKVGSHLKYHRRRHTGEAPYKCPHCGKCFHGPSHISDHIKKVHKTVYMGVNQRRKLNLPEDAPPPPPGILPSKDSKAKLSLAEVTDLHPPQHHNISTHLPTQVVLPPSMQPQQLSSSSMQHIPQHILPFGGPQSGHMLSTPTVMDQHVMHHNHYANIQFDQTNTQSPMPMVVRLLHDMQY